MQPNTYEDWLEVSMERQKDARALLSSRSTSIAPIYMAGYTVEASLKAFLLKLNKPFAKKGKEGHNLKSLWTQTGLNFSDLKDDNGEKTFFFDIWNTSLRYEISLDELQGNSPESLVKAAGTLSGLIQTQIRRKKAKRGKR